MSSFDLEKNIARRALAASEGAIIRMAQKTRDLRAQGHDVVSMTLGEPDFDTPISIQQAATRAMKAGFTHYAPVAGIPELRAAIVKKLATENGLDYAASEILVTNGAKQAIANGVMALVEPGDEVILLSHYWVSYHPLVCFCGGKPVVVQSSVAEGYIAPIERIKNSISERTKLLILNSPSNPSGALWAKAQLQQLADLVLAHPRMMVLSDEIYEYIVFEGQASSIAALPGMKQRTITVNGFSKSFAMTGWRLGYTAAPEGLTRAMMRLQSTITTGANQFVQRAAVTALEGPRDDVIAMRQSYAKRRDMVLKALRGMGGLTIGNIPATFYALPDVSYFLGKASGDHEIKTVENLCDYLLDKHNVATVPTTEFGAPHAIRLSFAISESELDKGLKRMAEGLSSLR